jgi:hypothetical protein
LADAMPRTDVALYGLVHEILEAERARDAAERRDGHRHSYRCIQWIAPMQEGRLPSAHQFQPVQCVDLSADGLMYLADAPPVGNELVVALGGERPICVKAQVVREEFIVHEGQPAYRIACRFTGRAT